MAASVCVVPQAGGLTHTGTCCKLLSGLRPRLVHFHPSATLRALDSRPRAYYVCRRSPAETRTARETSGCPSLAWKGFAFR